MANGRNLKRKGHDTSRDQGGFIALPWSVLDCPAYARLSMHARALLLEVARQFHRDDNGRMLLSRAFMDTRGWKSADMLTKAKRELLEGGFIFETVKGHRPNKASWYAVTWRAMDKLPGFDPGAAECFERGAYKKTAPPIGAVLIPPHGTGKVQIVPPHGTETLPTVPPHGPINAVLGGRSVPPHGHPLEIPSVVVCIGDVLATVPTDATPALFAAIQPGNSYPQHQSTSVTSDTRTEVAAALEVPTTECQFAATAASDVTDDGEDF